MKNIILSKLSVFTAALWWGSLTTLGFLVVPMLFQHLPTKALAGNVAARLFEAQTWVSVGCGLVLLLLLRLNSSKTLKSIENTGLEEKNALANVSIQYFAILFIALGMLLAADSSTKCNTV